MWNVFLIIVTFLLIGMVFYIETRLLKFSFMKKSNNKIMMYLLSLLPFLIILVFFDYVNFVVIVFHLFVFFLLYELLFHIIRKLTNKKSKLYLTGIFAIITTIVYMSIGYYLNSSIVETKYVINTTKDIKENIRILQITDTHIGTSLSSEKFSKYVDKMNKTNPDIVVITGDFIDDNTKKEDMISSVEALKKFKTKYGVYFTYGNHDKGYFTKDGFSETDLINELIKNEITILEDQVMLFEDDFYLIGREDKRYNRLSIDELTSSLNKDKYMIVLNHQPNDYENESKANVDLVLSGHTHGGQLFPFGYVGVLIGANDAFKGLEKRDNTNFIVNTGMSGWEILFKTGTRSEYTIIDIVGKSNNE